MTDQALHYRAVGKEFSENGAVNHGTFEWKRGHIHTTQLKATIRYSNAE